MMYRVGRLTEGWPVLRVLCARMVEEGTLDAAFADFGAEQFRDLFDFVDRQVLAKLPPDVLRALCAAAGFDDLRTAELDGLLEHSGVRTGSLLSRKYQVTSDPRCATHRGRSAHPRRRPRPLRRRGSQDAAEPGGGLGRRRSGRARRAMLRPGREIARAAELIRSTDSSALDALYVFSSLPAHLDRTSLPCYPEVWAALIGARRLSEQPDVLVHEAQMVLASLGPDASEIMVDTIVGLSAILPGRRRAHRRGARHARARPADPAAGRARRRPPPHFSRACDARFMREGRTTRRWRRGTRCSATCSRSAPGSRTSPVSRSSRPRARAGNGRSNTKWSSRCSRARARVACRPSSGRRWPKASSVRGWRVKTTS